jgi:RNA polymerase sigma-70 factor (ECF subfamily)
MIDARVRQFYEHNGRTILGRARTLLADVDAAKDVMQEVVLLVVTKETRVLDLPRPGPWLYRVTTNMCLNRLRDERRRQELLGAGPGEQVHPEDVEKRAIVLDILRRVPAGLQEVAVYHYVDEMTHDEIADLVGISRRTVGNRLAAFKKRITLVLREGAA